MIASLPSLKNIRAIRYSSTFLYAKTCTAVFKMSFMPSRIACRAVVITPV